MLDQHGGEALVVAGECVLLAEKPGLVGEDPVELPSFEGLLLRLFVEQDLVEAVEEVQAVRNGLRRADDGGERCPVEEAVQFV